MWMRPLRSINGIGRARFHPTQVLLGRLAAGADILWRGMTARAPLGTRVRRLRETKLACAAGGGVDQKQPPVRMIGVAKDLCSITIRSDVPGIKLRDGRDRSRVPIHSSELEGPDREDEVAGIAQERLVHHEFFIRVL